MATRRGLGVRFPRYVNLNLIYFAPHRTKPKCMSLTLYWLPQRRRKFMHATLRLMIFAKWATFPWDRRGTSDAIRLSALSFIWLVFSEMLTYSLAAYGIALGLPAV